MEEMMRESWRHATFWGNEKTEWRIVEFEIKLNERKGPDGRLAEALQLWRAMVLLEQNDVRNVSYDEIQPRG